MSTMNWLFVVMVTLVLLSALHTRSLIERRLRVLITDPKLTELIIISLIPAWCCTEPA